MVAGVWICSHHLSPLKQKSLDPEQITCWVQQAVTVTSEAKILVKVLSSKSWEKDESIAFMIIVSYVFFLMPGIIENEKKKV